VVKRLKHDKYVEHLCDKIRPAYDQLLTNVPLYSKKGKRRIAEIDILAIRDDEFDVYEVKCSYRVTKAKKQLHRIRRIMPDINSMFFFCGESSLLENVM